MNYLQLMCFQWTKGCSNWFSKNFIYRLSHVKFQSYPSSQILCALLALSHSTRRLSPSICYLQRISSNRWPLRFLYFQNWFDIWSYWQKLTLNWKALRQLNLWHRICSSQVSKLHQAARFWLRIYLGLTGISWQGTFHETKNNWFSRKRLQAWIRLMNLASRDF